MSSLSKEQLEGLQQALDDHEPVPLSCQMNHFGFEFIISQPKIADVEKYKRDQGIVIVSTQSIPGRYQARLIMSNNSSQMINLREEK